MIPNVLNLSSYITAALASLGAVVAVCVGGYIVFKLVKAGCVWLTCNTLDKHNGSCSMCREFKK